MYELTRLFLLIKTLNKHQKRPCLDTGTVTKKRSRVHFTPREGRNPSWNNRWELASLPGPWKNRDVSCPGVLDFQDCHNQIPQTGWLKWQKCISHSCGSQVGFFWGLSLLGLQNHLNVSLLILCWLIISFYKDTSHIEIGPAHMTFQAPLSMGFSRQEYWSGLPFPTPGNDPDSGIESTSLMSPASHMSAALAVRFFTISAT